MAVPSAAQEKATRSKMKNNNNNKQTDRPRPSGGRPSKGPEKTQQHRKSMLIRHPDFLHSILKLWASTQLRTCTSLEASTYAARGLVTAGNSRHYEQIGTGRSNAYG